MRLPSARLLPILLATLALAGCLDNQRRDISLENTLRKYESTVRWGHLENAYLFARVDPAAPPQIPPGLDAVRVTSYEVVRPVSQPQENRAVQIVQIQYLFSDQQVVRSVVDQQVWEYDEETELWYLASPVVSLR